MYKTRQENFWAGEFGNDYIKRNDGEKMLASNLKLFSDILSDVNEKIGSCIEFGANIGMNLSAIKMLVPNIKLGAVEINREAATILKQRINNIKIYEDSLLNTSIEEKYDVVLIKGVLIHINHEELKNVYKKLYDCSKKYIVVAEYYSPRPVSVNYRGEDDVLFKRDFAGEIMDMYNDLKLVNYGFVYHRDKLFPEDDINWFLLEK